MPMISLSDDAKARVEVAGSGPALVLISGLGGTLGFWDRLLEELGSNVRTIRFDQRGVGGSERGLQPVTIGSLAADAWHIIDALGVEHPVLCGHSTGGAIVQEMELMRAGTASGIVLSGSWAGPNLFMTRLFDIRREILTKLPERYAEFSALLGSPPRWLHETPGVLQQAMAHVPNDVEAGVISERMEALLAHDCRTRLSGIIAPTLVLGAEDDMIVPAYLQEELAALLNDPQIHVFDKGGHFYPITRTAETAKLLLNWMAKLDT